MIRLLWVGLVLIALAGPRLDAQEMPKPVKEHAWLEKLAGDWISESEVMMGPDNWIKVKGAEKCRTHGGFWIIAEGEAEIMGTKVNSILTLGYDPEKKKYIGTWVDNCAAHMWRYEGTLDAAGKVLTLDTEGPNMMVPGKTSKYREVITLVGPDEKTFSSSILGDDGKWTTFVKATYKRKK